MKPSERRARLRRHLEEGETCIQPASVFDPPSVRIAESLGFTVGMFAGSVASIVILGAPDITLITLSELAEQVRRITRAGDISLIVDADHGYGNALNVMRTVQELEAAGAAALTIEDTLLPQAYGAGGGGDLIPLPELQGKLKAALEAREDPSLVVMGRTAAMGIAGTEEAVARIRAMSDLGVDAVFMTGVSTREQIETAHGATSLPLVLGSTPVGLEDSTFLAANGVRIALRGHATYQVTLQAVYEALHHQSTGGMPASLQERLPSAELMARVLRTDEYAQWREAFLHD